MIFRRTRKARWIAVLAFCSIMRFVFAGPDSKPNPAGSNQSGFRIASKSSHFSDPAQGHGPWRFEPAANVASVDSKPTPGALTIRLSGKGSDVKGLLDEPIRLDASTGSWSFRLGMIQDQDAVAGHLGTRSQINYAFGLNVALTFSDPSLWPSDRKQRPPDTHDFQLLVVHLGSTGEVAPGLPQYSKDMHPERYLVWGRGDLGYAATGLWDTPTFAIGNGMKSGGPANSQVSFRCQVDGPGSVSVGIKFDPASDYRMRRLDYTETFGAATGIWEIGPIIAGDRWIPDVLCRVLPREHGPEPILIGPEIKNGQEIPNLVRIASPRPDPPHSGVKYLIDYAIFDSQSGRGFETMSDEFETPGYLDPGRFQLYGSKIDTHSHPGQLTLTKMGRSLECFAWGTPPRMKFDEFTPPFEIEACVIPPDDRWNWDFDLGFAFVGEDGSQAGVWYPGIRNLPVSKKREVYDPFSPIKLRFEKPIHNAIQGDRIHFLVQFLDREHVRLGVRANEQDSWRLSDTVDLKRFVSRPVMALDFIAWNASCGTPPPGEDVGTPLFQQYRWEFIRYRSGTTAK